MKPARVIVDPSPPDRGVAITWREGVDARRRRRVGEILADILDNAATPDERRKP